MKTPLLGLASLLLGCAPLYSQTQTSTVVPSVAISARDGFTRDGTGVLFTKNGASRKVEKEMALDNGLRVRPDGTVTLPNGDKASIGNNQLLTPEGRLEDVALTPGGTAPVTTGGAPVKMQGEEVGLAPTDGISISGGDTLVTRNGVSERMLKEMKLTNGTVVKPGGVVTMPDGSQITLRLDQVLTFNGALRVVPPRPNTNPGRPDATTAIPGAAR